MSQDIEDQRKEFNQTEYYQTFTRNAVAKLPKLSRRIVEQAIKEMEDDGYQFNKKQVGNVEQYALTIQNVIDIYAHRKIPKYRDIHKSPYVIFVVNLKGGVSKTVSTVTLAHALRVHQDLLRHDLRILVIDLDPQASSTMFLDHTHSIGSILETAAQAMLNDLDAETLRKEVIRPTIVPGVDVIPASIDDGFVASQWKELVEEHLPDKISTKSFDAISLIVLRMIMTLSLLIPVHTWIRSCSTVWRPAICCLPLPHQPRLTSTQH